MKGQNLRVFIDGKCIAKATSCSLHIAAATEDSSTKDSTGSWDEFEVTGRSWDASTESLLVLTDTAEAKNTVDLVSLGIETPEVTISFDTTTGEMNRTAQDSTIKMSGKAFLTDLTITATNKQSVTASARFTGNGPLGLSNASSQGNGPGTTPGDPVEV